jgi:hypothetical protein
MADTVSSQNIDLSSRDTLYNSSYLLFADNLKVYSSMNDVWIMA